MCKDEGLAVFSNSQADQAGEDLGGELEADVARGEVALRDARVVDGRGDGRLVWRAASSLVTRNL